MGDKAKLTCPGFFYESGKSGDNYKKKIKVEVNLDRDNSLAKTKTDICIFFLLIHDAFMVAKFRNIGLDSV